MSWPAHDVTHYRCDRCGRRHGFEGCPGSHAPPQHTHATGPQAQVTGPHGYVTGSHAYVTGPQAHVTGSHAYVTGPQAHVAGSRAYVGRPHSTGPNAYVTGPHGQVTGPHPPALPPQPGYLGHSARGGRHPLAPASQPDPLPPPSPLDWTGQLGGWSESVAQVNLDTRGRAEPGHPLSDRSDRRDTGEGRVVRDAGFPGRGDDVWPSVTTDPFGTGAQAAVRAERRERSRTASFGFPLHTHTPRRARRHTVEFAEHWGLHHLVEAAEVVVSELMTNALEASLPERGRRGVAMVVAPLELRLSADGGQLRIEIRDHIPDPPVLVEDPDVDDERGRGLILVDNYCEVWGYHRLSTGGKVVWCLLGPSADA